ncbi:MAG: YbfB/YjiJ family MFS transporter [SAR324 cluster bacterium]|nr:YbfB/YjiJ family MFS transporter [SAR324 cluster bacterium]
MQPVAEGRNAGRENVRVWRAALSGLCASLVGIGLARFSYTPLIPALITANWFEPSQVAFLGAANLAGYLAGALIGQRLATWASSATVLRAMMVLATLSFFTSAFPLSFSWYFLWRFASGLSGGTIMVLAGPAILPHVPPSRRGLVGGAIFTGVGLGIAASGTLVPLLLRFGLFTTWCGLGVLALILTVVAWGGWPAEEAGSATPHPIGIASGPRSGWALKSFYVEYGLNAVGLVPHMVFLVDFIARGLGQGLAIGARYWVLFGLGATVGPILAGHLADRIGFKSAIRLAFLLQAMAIALPTFTVSPAGLIVSTLFIGACVPGIVPLALGRVQELTPPEGHRAAWSLATIAFALGQAGAAYAFSYIYATGAGAFPLFALGVAALILALVMDLSAPSRDGEGRG